MDARLVFVALKAHTPGRQLRCLKRHLARVVFKILVDVHQPTAAPPTALALT